MVYKFHQKIVMTSSWANRHASGTQITPNLEWKIFNTCMRRLKWIMLFANHIEYWFSALLMKKRILMSIADMRQWCSGLIPFIRKWSEAWGDSSSSERMACIPFGKGSQDLPYPFHTSIPSHGNRLKYRGRLPLVSSAAY